MSYSLFEESDYLITCSSKEYFDYTSGDDSSTHSKMSGKTTPISTRKAEKSSMAISSSTSLETVEQRLKKRKAERKRAKEALDKNREENLTYMTAIQPGE